MAQFESKLQQVKLHDLGLYLSNRPTEEMTIAATQAPFVVLRGLGGARLATKLPAKGISCPVVLDPAGYEPTTSDAADWLALQANLDSPISVSPGSYLSVANVAEWERLHDSEAAWCDRAVRNAHLSLCITTDALIQHREALGELFRSTGLPIWLTLSHSGDPLAKSGAVQALVDLVAATPRLTLMRSDLGALGAIAFGADLGSVGISATVRHVAPRKGGGGPLRHQPSVFVRTLLDWKKAETLLGWLQRAGDEVERHLTCTEICCEGQPITRFAEPEFVGQIQMHNVACWMALQEEIVACERSRRPAKFVSMAGHAYYQNEWLAESVPDVEASRQIKQWRDLET